MGWVDDQPNGRRPEKVNFALSPVKGFHLAGK